MQKKLQIFLFMFLFLACGSIMTAQPENDEPSGAIVLTVGENGPFTNIDATPNADDLNGGACGTIGTGNGWSEADIQNSVWFTYLGTGSTVSITSNNDCNEAPNNNDTQFAVYEGESDGPLVVCNDDISAASFLSSVEVATTAGVTYYLLVDGWDGASGNFCITIGEPAVCGDGECTDAETYANCPGDCPCDSQTGFIDESGPAFSDVPVFVCLPNGLIEVAVIVTGGDEVYDIDVNGTVVLEGYDNFDNGLIYTTIQIDQDIVDASAGGVMTIGFTSATNTDCDVSVDITIADYNIEDIAALCGDVECVFEADWIDDVALTTTTAPIVYCGLTADTLFVPVGVLETVDTLYNVSIGGETVIADLPNSFVGYAYVTQDMIDASGGMVTIDFVGVNQTDCASSLLLDLVALDLLDIAANCAGAGCVDGVYLDFAGGAAAPSDSPVIYCGDDELLGGDASDNTVVIIPFGIISGDTDYGVTTTAGSSVSTLGNAIPGFLSLSQADIDGAGGSVTINIAGINDPASCGILTVDLTGVSVEAICGGTAAVCGNGICEAGETPETCPEDCAVEPGEGCLSFGAGPYTDQGALDLAGCDGSSVQAAYASWDNEIYFSVVQAGGNYTIDLVGCDQAAWGGELTITVVQGGDAGTEFDAAVSPLTGAVLGTVTGSCSITFDAAVSGVVYFTVTSNCGGAVQQIDNGVFTLTTNSGVECAECGDGVCDATETYETCPNDCPCIYDADWIDDVALTTTANPIIYCGLSGDTLFVPVGTLTALDTLFTVSIGDEVVIEDLPNAFVGYAYITQDMIDASGGMITIDFVGVNQTECATSLLLDLVALDFLDIAASCAGAGCTDGVYLDFAGGAAAPSDNPVIYCGDDELLGGNATDNTVIQIPFGIISGDTDYAVTTSAGFALDALGNAVPGFLVMSQADIDAAGGSVTITMTGVNDPASCGFLTVDLTGVTVEAICGGTAAVCGNGICEAGETPENCPGDCAVEPSEGCLDFVAGPYTDQGALDLAGCDGSSVAAAYASWDNEIYFSVVQAGGNYTIDLVGCDQAAWGGELTITVVQGGDAGTEFDAASPLTGTVLGTVTGSCSVTFDAAVTGVVYFTVSSNCGGALQQIDNGVFTLTTNSGVSCAECGDGVCDATESYETCPNDCPCIYDADWIDDVALTTTANPIVYCGVSADTLFIPVGVLSTVDTVYNVTIGGETVISDLPGSFVGYAYVTQDMIDASGGMISIDFTGVNQTECSTSLLLDLVALDLLDIAAACNPDGCTAVGGTISTTDPTTVCVGDGVADLITPIVEGNVGENTAWVITDDAGNILDIGTPPFDFDGAPAGNCLIWALSWDGDITGAEIGANAGDLAGDCFELSNSIEVIRLDDCGDCTAVGGTISTTDPTTVCVGNGVADLITPTVTGNAGENTAWVITDAAGNILDIGTPPFDFDGAPAGNCLIWALSWDGDITGAEVGANAGDLAGDCFVLSNSIEVIRLGPDDDACTEPCPDPGTGNTDICVGNTEVWNTETCAYDVAVVQVLGCTDPAYTEFNAAANCDDGSCVTLVGGIVGCTNPDACNYLASATVDGPCSFPGDPCGIGGTWNDDCDCPDTQCEGEYGTQVATIPDLLVEPFGTSEPWEFEGQTTGAGFIFGYILSTNLDCNNNVTAYNVVGFNTTGMFDFSSPELTFDGGGIGPGCYGPNSGLYNVHPISFQGTQAELESWLAIYNTLEEFDNAIDNGVFCANFPTLGDSQDGQYSLFILDEPCDPSAGTISTNNSGFYCAGSNNTITAMSSGFNNTANYTQLYVLTGSSVFTIYDVNTSGSFTTPGPGSYTIHALNVDSDEAASINLSDLIGLNALDVIGTLECYDLVTSSNFFTVLNPISVNLSDYDCNEESGVATVTVSITGGYPEALGAGNYQASGDLSGTIAYGSPYVIDFSDNTNISISASDDLGCSGTGGQNYPACTKTAVELLDFDGRVEEAGNNLFWATATEENSAYFMVQRSIDGVNFQDIAKVDAAGNSNVMINYSLMDDQAPAGTSIYRLEMVDFDGSTEYSNTVSLDRRAESFGIISVGPVPANNNINIVFNSNSELETALEVIDATGKLIDLVKVESTIGLNKVVLDVNSYASGVYFINVTNGTNVAVEKFMKD